MLLAYHEAQKNDRTKQVRPVADLKAELEWG